MRIRKQVDAKWFDFDDDPDEGRVKIQHLKPVEEQDSWTEAFAYAMGKYSDADQTAPSFLTFVNRKSIEINVVKSVVEWENFFDKSGEPLECNKENVLLTMQEIDGCYNSFVVFRNELKESVDEEKEVQEKN